MKYEELKKFDLNSIKSQEDADKWKNTVIASDKIDILKYVNFLRWQQFNKADINYMNRIVNFLSFDELIDFESENSNLITGDTEDLVLTAEIEKKDEKVLENPIYVDGKPYEVKTILEDDFENIMIVTDGEKLCKFGFIVIPGLQGIDMYAYELFEESQDYYQQIIDAKSNTKINVFCDVVGENQVTKTFKKSDLLITNGSCFILAIKSNKGIMSPVTKEGTFSILKKEDVLSADGISEDRLQNQISKYQQEMAEKLGCKLDDIKTAAASVDKEEPKKQYTAEDFADEFKFAEKYQFSVVSPEDDEEYSHINPLTHTVLEINNADGTINEEYIEEVYQLLYRRFGIVEEKEGFWSIENIKLDRVVRKLINAGADVKIVEATANNFLKRFISQNMVGILNPIMNLQIVKKIKTQKDVEDFAKDSGTELYVQIGQVMTSVLEGTQRLYGENHMVFDSDRKLIICKFDKLDLREASEYAIENGYDNFYVIEKDKYTQYDAWYKETLKTKTDGETTTTVTTTTVTTTPSANNTTFSNFTPAEELNCEEDDCEEDDCENDNCAELKLERVVNGPTDSDETTNKFLNVEYPKITTELCVSAIVEHFKDSTEDMTNPKNWKRGSKKGSGTITREFKNKVNDKIVKVVSTETKILQITDGNTLSGMYRFVVENSYTFGYDSFKKGDSPLTDQFMICVFPVDEVAYMNMGFDDNCVYIQSPKVAEVLNPIGIDGEDEDNTFTYFIDKYKTKKELTDYLISCGWVEDKSLASFV